ITRKLLSKIIDEDSIAISVDVTQWHRYRLEWSPRRVVWYVDDAPAFESPVSPNPPLGVIIWIDNQYAAFTPGGKIAFGVLEGEDEWIEVEEVVISEK
ncbi:MAG: family 16 glycosylhydrolase, partial [Anaerolineales bacterium]|nr:family 16 glycosylhydrolase [Anaerolineales bacterium]